MVHEIYSGAHRRRVSDLGVAAFHEPHVCCSRPALVATLAGSVAGSAGAVAATTAPMATWTASDCRT